MEDALAARQPGLSIFPYQTQNIKRAQSGKIEARDFRVLHGCNSPLVKEIPKRSDLWSAFP